MLQLRSLNTFCTVQSIVWNKEYTQLISRETTMEIHCWNLVSYFCVGYIMTILGDRREEGSNKSYIWKGISKQWNGSWTEKG